jgi:hypothetical protein
LVPAALPRDVRTGASPGRSTDTIIARLAAMRTRSQQMLAEMTRLELQFRRNSERNGQT